MMKVIQSLCILLQVVISFVHGYGEEAYGFPSWQERAAHVLTNAVRQSPWQYRQQYMSYNANERNILGSTYPWQYGLYYDILLQVAARNYADLLAKRTTPCDNGDEHRCDSTSPSQRYYNAGWRCTQNEFSENIGYGMLPIDGVNGLVCDASTIDDCPADGSGDPHRAGIMQSGKYWLGTGFSNQNNAIKYVQEFTSQGSCNSITNSIVAASHFPWEGRTRFMAQVRNQAITNLYLVYSTRNGWNVVDMAAQNGQPALGSSGQGIYTYDMDTVNNCRSYYFVLYVNNGGGSYYPDTGTLVTYGEGTCTTAYLNNDSNGNRQGGNWWGDVISRQGPYTVLDNNCGFTNGWNTYANNGAILNRCVTYANQKTFAITYPASAGGPYLMFGSPRPAGTGPANGFFYLQWFASSSQSGLQYTVSAGSFNIAFYPPSGSFKAYKLRLSQLNIPVNQNFLDTVIFWSPNDRSSSPTLYIYWLQTTSSSTIGAATPCSSGTNSSFVNTTEGNTIYCGANSEPAPYTDPTATPTPAPQKISTSAATTVSASSSSFCLVSLAAVLVLAMF